jgi:hypothetical protein
VRVSAQLSQVKLCLSEPHVNGRFDGRDQVCISTGYAKGAEKRTDHGTVTRRLPTLRQQQARLSTLCRCGDSHGFPSFNTALFPYRIWHHIASELYRLLRGKT